MAPAPHLHDPWGKLDRSADDPSRAARLSLVAHCIDVAAVVRALLELPTWQARMEQLAGRRLTPAEWDRLTVLAFLHDAGKASAGFQAKALTPARRLAWALQAGLTSSEQGHTRVVAPLLSAEPRFAEHARCLGLPDVRAWGGGTSSHVELWLAAVSHHGEPLTLDSLKGASGAWRTWTAEVDGYLPLHGLRSLGAAARELWPAAYESSPAPLLPFAPAFVHAFAGLVSLADWIGSNTANRAFPYDYAPQDVARWSHALPRARQVLRRMCIDVEDLRADLLRRQPTFVELFGSRPYPAQEAAADPSLPSPVVLEAETGSGKTEAALWRFKCLFEQGQVDALCFLLPTRVAATGIAARIDDFVQKLFPDPHRRPNTVLAVPSYLRANGQDGQRLPGYEVMWPDTPDEPLAYWAAENSKRYFAGAAVAGTVDQFLLSTLQTRHSHLRGAALLRALVVVDEVHASDRFMRVLLGHALRRHVAAGGHALLLSATLTSDLRDELIGNQRPRPRMRGAAAAPAPPPETVSHPAMDYPRISAPQRAPWVGRMGWQKQVHVTLQPWMRDVEAVAACAAQAVQAGARVLVLRNTVRQAVATQQALERALGITHPALFRCGGVPTLHHGRFALPDRQALDRAVGAQFGKGAAQLTGPLVACATQTIEISVDCDADFLITDLAPMDVLLQRLGRLHRHRQRDASRTHSYRQAQAVVLTPGTHDLAALLSPGAARGLGVGARSAYPDLLCLQATLQALSDPRFQPLSIPQHNRELVERSCSTKALAALAAERGSRWLEHLQALSGRRSAEGQQALFSVVDWFAPWDAAAPGDLAMEARTRLGLDGVEVELPGQPQRSALGHDIDRITLPAWMLPDQDAALRSVPQMEALRCSPEALRFLVRGRGFVYDRFGLAAAPDGS